MKKSKEMKKLKDINWNQIYYFYEVARKSSMKEASRAIGVNISTVSEQIKRLESFLDQRLFYRAPRKITLTNEGISLFHHSREMFETGTRILDTLSTSSIGGYSVRVGIQETVSAPQALNFVTKYWDLFSPYGSVNTFRELLPEELIKKVLINELDWAITLDQPKSPRLASKLISQVEMVFCVSPKLYRKFKEKSDLLRVLPLARSSWDHLLNSLVDDHLTQRGIFPEEIIQTDHREFAINLCQRGRCVAVFAKETVENSTWGSSVRTFSLRTPIHLSHYAVWPKASERMIAIRKLRGLLESKEYPDSYLDHEHQVRLNETHSGPNPS